MKIAIHKDKVICAEVGPYYEQLRSTGRFKWDRRSSTMQGDLCLITLEALNSCCRLPGYVAQEYERLRTVREAMEEQRRAEKPELLCHVPVKNCELMGHQIVGVNMALLLFGAVGAGRECRQQPPVSQHKAQVRPAKTSFGVSLPFKGGDSYGGADDGR